jgi:hypothetical protein
MVEVANSYNDKTEQAKYLAAAARFRLPYWDIVMPRKDPKDQDPETMWACPDILKQERVFVKLPDDKQGEFSEIDNPLASFKFPSDDEYNDHPERRALDQPGYNTIQTARNPTQASKGYTDSEQLDLAVQRQAGASAIAFWQALHPDYKHKDIRGQAEILVNEERSWESFANHDVQYDRIRGRVYATKSLESFHDTIHGIVGGGAFGMGGQMGNPAFAAVSLAQLDEA